MQSENRKVLTVGNYRFTGKLLGKGTFARVEEAVHNVLNVKVAVKIMDINKITEDYVIKNLYREGKLMAKLNHPNITSLFETMQKSDNVYYLVTELVSGGDLCTFIKGQRNGKLEERSAQIYARQFASALSHMHSLGIVHRDLKMENVMMNSLHTQIKIVDFGLGNFWRSDRALRTHCGSPEYAAPELFITGRKFGPEVDLWSFGVILYGMVIGQLPFISSKGEHISSQERRKRLVAQINKGLSTQHQRAIAYCSSDFRNLMNKLLIADISKRITIKELIQHPWITENGTKMIRTNSIIRIDIQEFAKIVNNISTLLRIDVDLILDSVKKKPFNKIGGIYNILVYKHTMGIFGNLQFSNEEINSTKFNVVRRQLSNRRNKNVVEKVCPSSAPVKIPNIPHSPYIQQLGEKVKKSNNYDNNKNIPNDDLKNKLLQNATRFYYKKQCNKLQEENNGKHNEESSINQNVDYRSIKSPSLRRKAYSASISTRTKSQTGTSEKCKYIFHKNNIVNDEIYDKTKIIMQSNENAPKQIEKNFTEVLTTKYTKKPRPATSTYVPLEKSKCEPRKKYTICGVPQHTAERLLKRFSSTPANCTNTISKTYKEKQDGKIARQMIASTQTCGDGFPLQTNKNIKRKFDQDPIARSIAGYMVHNIPSDTLK